MVEALIKRIQDLPAELFDQIQHHVLSYEPPAPNANGYHFIDVTKMYRFPNFLQIDRSTRESLAIAYYSQKVFRFSCAEDFQSFIKAMCDRHFALAAGFQAWIPRRSKQHVRFLTTFQKQMDVRAASCDRVMLGHFEPAHQAEDGENPVDPADQEVYVVWNEAVDEVKIWALPPELFSRIPKDALSYNNVDSIFIQLTPAYKIPVKLYINSDFQEANFKAFYSHNIFVFEGGDTAMIFISAIDDTAMPYPTRYRLDFPRAPESWRVRLLEVITYLNKQKNACAVSWVFEMRKARSLISIGEPFEHLDPSQDICVIRNRYL